MRYGTSHKYGQFTVVRGYCNLTWARERSDRKSITGFVLILAGSALRLKSQKQNIDALSSPDAEYIKFSFAIH